MRTVDLFAGCGGMSKGFQNAGFNIVAAFEYWKVAAQCYGENFTHPVFDMDLSNTESAIEIIRKFAPELIIGGPPCQDFSHAGKRIESGRASLTGSFADIVSAILPSYFIMENVDRAESSIAYACARETFKKSGYGLTEIVLDASRCGVPQKRKRFFCIGALMQTDDFLLSTINKCIDVKEMSLHDFFGETLDFEFYYRHPRNYSRRAIFSINEPAPTMRGVNRPVPKGYHGHANDACPLNENIRALTTLERALIQTFPAEFKWVGNKTDIEQMIGNAVPVKLAEFVAKSLLSFTNETKHIDVNGEGFLTWLVDTKEFSHRSAGDVVSRVRRANKIISISGVPESYYNFKLDQENEFQALSVGVRSQIKRALSLYSDYLQFAR